MALVVDDLPPASLAKETSEKAVVWRKAAKAARLKARYRGAAFHLALRCGKDTLIEGDWKPDVRLDGRAIEPVGDWEETCSVSDADVDYLELAIDLAGEVRVERHIVLARRERVAMLADAVLAPRSAFLEYRTSLPFGPKIVFRGGCETREATLVGGKPRARVLPLTLPEWLADRRRGEMTATAGRLELRETAEGQALFAPLWLDLDRRRLGKPLTWRQLTVAEALTAQPADVAVGYRVAVGRRQWLVYRSLTPARNRTLLGHNLSTEMLVARFRRNGEVESLIEVE